MYVDGLSRQGFFAARPVIGLLRADDPAHAQATETILRFRQRGVTLVMFLDREAGMALFFMQQAETQLYRPHYGLTSVSGPEFVRPNVPLEQLSGTVGVGWAPNYDVAEPQEPEPNENMRLCRTIFAELGADYASRPRSAAASARAGTTA